MSVRRVIPGLDRSEVMMLLRVLDRHQKEHVDQGSLDQLSVLFLVENHLGFSPLIFDEYCKS